jgi:hypothetical protein
MFREARASLQVRFIHEAMRRLLLLSLNRHLDYRTKGPLRKSVNASGCGSLRPVESRLHTSHVNEAFSTRGTIHDAMNWLARIVLLPYKHQTLLYSACLYGNPYSDAGAHQRITRTHYGQKRAISSTRRTRVNAGEQRMLSNFFESYQNSSKATRGLKHFCFHLYTAMAATVQKPNYQRSEE